ncbi:hypothetical protein Peur_025935 [Populus x canadensis]
MAPEIYNDEIFDRSVDAYCFGVILYEMLEGVQPFHPKTPEEAVKLMCLEKKRPPFKIKNLLSDQPFLRSSQDWIKFVATVQNKDGGKTLLSFHVQEVTGEAFSDIFKKRKLGTRPRIFVDEINSFGASCYTLIIKGTNKLGLRSK